MQIDEKALEEMVRRIREPSPHGRQHFTLTIGEAMDLIRPNFAKPNEAQPVQEVHTLNLKLGSRLTVEGVEAVGMPSEEEIARAIASLRKHMRPDSKLPDILPSEMAQASAVLSIIRPAFEAKDTEIAAMHAAYQQAAMDAVALCHEAEARALAAEAKLAQAVEALGILATHFQGLIGMAEQSKRFASRQGSRLASGEHDA